MTTIKTSSAGTTVVAFPVTTGDVANWYVYQRRNGVVTSHAGRPSVYSVNRRVGRDSSITYYTGKQGYNPCLHTQKVWVATGSPRSAIQMDDYVKSSSTGPNVVIQGSSPWSTLHYYTKNYGNFISVANGESTPIFTDWNAMGAKALATMLPSVRPSLSVPNFIYELKDLRATWKTLMGKWGRPNQNVRKALAVAYGQRYGMKPMARLSNAILANEFAWRPFANDLIDLARGLLKMQSRIDVLIQRANSPQQSYYSAWISGSDQNAVTSHVQTNISSSTGVTGEFSCTGATQVVRHKSDGIRYSAVMRYSYPLPPEILGLSGQLRAALDTLGISGNPAIIWNAIPYSFVVDWFVNVGSYLERFDQKNVRFQTKITDFCHSIKYQRQVSYQVKAPNRRVNGSQSTTVFVEMDNCTIRYYDRRVGIPSLATAISMSGLNPREFLLGGALAGGRRR